MYLLTVEFTLSFGRSTPISNTSILVTRSPNTKTRFAMFSLPYRMMMIPHYVTTNYTLMTITTIHTSLNSDNGERFSPRSQTNLSLRSTVPKYSYVSSKFFQITHTTAFFCLQSVTSIVLLSLPRVFLRNSQRYNLCVVSFCNCIAVNSYDQRKSS